MKMLMLIKFMKIYLFMLILFMLTLLILLPSKLKNIHPLILGTIMLFYSILISLNLNIFNKSSMFSMIMFLIIVGGFLILFLYFNSFAMNNKMIFNMNMLNLYMYKMLIIIIMYTIIIYKNNLFNMILFLNNKLNETLSLFINNFNNYNNNNSINLIYTKMKILTLFSMIYLLFVLIIIVKIIFYIKPKSIRQLIK